MGSRSSASGSSGAADEIMGRLLLDIKALMILGGTEESLSRIVEEKIALSRDNQIAGFVSIIQSKKARPEPVRVNILIALGEMVLASILAVVGLAILAPSVTGLSSPSQLLAYFSQALSAVSTKSIPSPIVPIGVFLLALVLLIGAFYNLRVAASNLKALRWASGGSSAPTSQLNAQ
jgi:hypothetical protein